MRICPVCPVMEIIIPVVVTEVEQGAVPVLWGQPVRQVPEDARECQDLWDPRDRRGNLGYRDIQGQRVPQE